MMVILLVLVALIAASALLGNDSRQAKAEFCRAECVEHLATPHTR